MTDPAKGDSGRRLEPAVPVSPRVAFPLVVRAMLLALALVTAGCGGAADESASPNAEPASTVATRLEEARQLRRAGSYDESAALYQRLRDELAGADDRESHWAAVNGWIGARLEAGHHDEAKEALAELRSLAAGDAVLESRTELQAAAILHREGDLAGAETAAIAAQEHARRADNADREARAMGMLATVYSLGGRYREALDMNEQIVVLRRESDPGSADLALDLNEVGIGYRHFGRFDESFHVLEEALDLYRENGHRQGEAMVMFNLANVHLNTGNPERGLELKSAALEINDEIGHSYGRGLNHKGLASIYFDAGDLERARWHVEQALEINRAARQTYGELSSLELLGRMELETGELERAGEVLGEALELADDRGYGREAATVRVALSLVAARQGRGDEALRLADAALERALEMDDPDVELQAREARGIALEALGRIRDAAEAHRGGIALLESWRGRLALGDLRMGVSDARSTVYESAVRCLFQQGDVSGALEINERARARLLLELVAERGPSGVSRRASLQREVRETFLMLSGASDEARGPIRSEIDALFAELRALRDATAQEQAGRGAARFPAPATVAEIEAGLVKPGRGILAYLWGEDELFAWLLDADGLRGRSLGDVKEIGSLVEFLRAAMKTPSAADWRPSARRAFERLVAPLDPQDYEELYVVADGPLALLPFEVLLPSDDAVPWGASVPVVYGPSASYMLAARGAPAPDTPREVLAVAYGAARDGADRPGASTRDRLGRLPEAESEARHVYELFGRERSALLSGTAASLDRWRGLDPAGFRILHFAAHAVIDPSGRRGRLLLADGDLDAGAIRELDLQAELVTLSACSTAQGRRVRGEGIVGLSHAFLAAGARQVVVSLWRVDDRQASAFMRDFYEALRAGRSAAEALRVARARRLSAEGPAAHPSAWAPFILIGG